MPLPSYLGCGAGKRQLHTEDAWWCLKGPQSAELFISISSAAIADAPNELSHSGVWISEDQRAIACVPPTLYHCQMAARSRAVALQEASTALILAASVDPREDLRNERARATFDVDELSCALNGGKEQLERR